MTIGVDIDDTLAKTTEYLLDKALKYDKEIVHGKGLVYPEKEIPRCFDWNQEEIEGFFQQVLNPNVLEIPPMDEAKEVISKLRTEGHKIIIISARNTLQLEDPQGSTEQWLKNHEITVDKVITGARYKSPVLEDEKADMLIDDSVGQCTFVADNNKIPVILFANRTNNIQHAGVVRLTCWKEIYEYVHNMNKVNQKCL